MVIENLKNDLDALTVEAGALRKGGEEMDGLVKSISMLIFELSDERGEPKRFIKDEDRFAKAINKISKKIDKIKNKLQELSVEQPETKIPEPQEEVKDEIKEDIQELETITAGDDRESINVKEHYNHAERTLEELESYLQNHNIENPQGLSIENYIKSLKGMLGRMKEKLDQKLYDDFEEIDINFELGVKDAYKIFPKSPDQVPKQQPKEKEISDEDLKKIAIELGVGKEQPEPEKKKVAKEKKVTVIGLEDAEADWGLLEEIGVKLLSKEKRQETNELTKRINQILRLAGKADRANLPNEVEEQMKRFEHTFKELLSKIPENIYKEFKSQLAGNAPSWEKTKEKEKSVEKVKEPKKETEPVLEEQIIEEKPIEEEKLSLELHPLEPENEDVEIDVSDLQGEPVKPSAELKTSEKEPVMSGEIPDKGIVAEKMVKAENKVEIIPDYPVEVKQEPKKGLWSRFKEAVFNRETKKVAQKVSYDTVTSVLGVKLITDALYAIKGKGDLAEWWKGRKESKGSREAINEAYQNLIESFEKNKKNKTLEESEKIVQHLADLKTKVESADISPEEKKALLDRLWLISMKHEQDSKATAKDRNKQVDSALDSYIQGKISGMKIARDGLNFALTATGFAMLRGLMYAGTAIAERAGKARKEFDKKTFGANEKKTELKFVAKDVFVNSAIETARALTGRGEKEGVGGVKRTVDFIKALGTIARGFGIYGLAISGTTVHEQAIDKLLSQLKENGAAVTVSKNFAEHVERVWETYSNPTNILGGNKESEKPEVPSGPEQPPIVERPEVPVPAEVPQGISIDQIIDDNKLSAEFSDSLVSFLKEHPELSNKESIENILNASKIGPDAHSHHGNIIKGTIDTLDESGGERRQVIFEEILKHGGPQAAANYLQSQHFSSYHLRHLSGHINKGTPDEFLKFAEKYNTNDPRMVSGLFQAMQGRESTDLANAGLEVDAVNGKPGIDNHVRGKVSYFGLEGGKPVLSGSGTVTVDQMGVRGAVVEKTVAPDKELDLGKTDIKESIREDWQKMGSRLAPQWEGNASVQAETNTVVPQTESSRTEAVRPATRVEKTLNTYKSSESTPVAEAAPVVAPVEKNIPAEKMPAPKQAPETNVEKSAEKSPIASEPHADAPLNKFLVEHGSNQKEFFGNFQTMRAAIEKHMDSSLVYTEGSSKFLEEKTNYLYGLQEKYKSALEHNLKLSSTDLRQIDKIIETEELYKNRKDEWVEALGKSLFNKEDGKVMELVFAEHSNPDLEPILANNSNAVRIWDPAKKKDVIWYVEDTTFNVNKNGDLIVKDSSGEKIMDKETVLKLAKQ